MPQSSTAFESDVNAVRWDLTDLLDGKDLDPSEAIDRCLAEAIELAERFQKQYAGEIEAISSDQLLEAMRQLERMYELVSRAGSYASLSFSTNTTDPARGALLQRVEERSTEIETRLLFFELEWAALPEERAEELIATADLDFCRHFLRSIRRYRPHMRTEAEEKILAEKALTGRSAWTRLFEEQASAINVEVNGEEVPLTTALAQLYSPDREIRRQTGEQISTALDKSLNTRAFVFNTLLADKMVDDRLRSYPTWISSRNLDNEVSDEAVQALIVAVREHYEVPRRWYRLKAKLLGVERIADYDRFAPVIDTDRHYSWDESRSLVLDAFHDFSDEIGTLAEEFFAKPWIDAPVYAGKHGGGFCAYTVPSVHPYVLLNFTGRMRDVLVLAHELGHALHARLAAPQRIFQMNTPLTLAETASVFGEEIVYGRLLSKAETNEERLALAAESVEGAIATVFRQIAMNRFEDFVHTERRTKGELSPQRFGELWLKSQTEMLDDSIEITEGYKSWWSYVPHFISTPGYVYAYAFGQLFALSIYARYVQEGDAFVPAYLDLLRAGGSRKPEELASIVGIDIADPGFWESGLQIVERQLVAAEAAAGAVLTQRELNSN